jgi:hypothetical protein
VGKLWARCCEQARLCIGHAQVQLTDVLQHWEWASWLDVHACLNVSSNACHEPPHAARSGSDDDDGGSEFGNWSGDGFGGFWDDWAASGGGGGGGGNGNWHGGGGGGSGGSWGGGGYSEGAFHFNRALYECMW